VGFEGFIPLPWCAKVLCGFLGFAPKHVMNYLKSTRFRFVFCMKSQQQRYRFLMLRATLCWVLARKVAIELNDAKLFLLPLSFNTADCAAGNTISKVS
jgi:hypothetical protein